MSIITRFAPSPTGFLHIGGARTALFNYLYSRHHGGKFLLRIEDTDAARSTQPAIDAILEGLKWLGLNWDGEFILQSSRINRHREVALALLEKGQAYYCYDSPEQLEIYRQEALQARRPYISKWREKQAPVSNKLPPVIRLKTPLEGTMVINDLVQGKVEFPYQEIDDFVLLRSDGTPTYMLAVVVDDYDANITHVIRGDDHLTNAARQNVIYDAMGWARPEYAHIPLIHGEDGAKLSKRHGALGIDAYKEMGYLPEAICNYLLRLGWSHGNDEIISREKAIEWFDLDKVGRSPARFDFKKLDNLNAHYLKNADDEKLLDEILPFIKVLHKKDLIEIERQFIAKGLNSLKQRAKSLKEMAEKALFYIQEAEFLLTDEAKEYLTQENITLLEEVIKLYQSISEWNKEVLMDATKKLAQDKQMTLGDIVQMPRIALTGSLASPSIFEIMTIFGKEYSLRRLQHFINFCKNLHQKC